MILVLELIVEFIASRYIKCSIKIINIFSYLFQFISYFLFVLFKCSCQLFSIIQGFISLLFSSLNENLKLLSLKTWNKIMVHQQKGNNWTTHNMYLLDFIQTYLSFKKVYIKIFKMSRNSNYIFFHEKLRINLTLDKYSFISRFIDARICCKPPKVA